MLDFEIFESESNLDKMEMEEEGEEEAEEGVEEKEADVDGIKNSGLDLTPFEKFGFFSFADLLPFSGENFMNSAENLVLFISSAEMPAEFFGQIFPFRFALVFANDVFRLDVAAIF